MIKRSIHQDDTEILNVYAANSRAAKYMKQKLMELKEIDNSKITVGDLYPPQFMEQLDRESAKIQKNSRYHQ